MRLGFRRRERADARRAWPLIVGGCHRSGTSLTRRILNAHSRIHCGPEIKFFRDFYADYFDDPLRHLRFLSSARAIVPEDDLLEVAGRAFVSLHERAAARAGKPRWADKNPENVLYLEPWQRLLGERWLMIHLVRHPLDTLASMKEARFPLTIPAELDERIAFYRRYTAAGLAFGERQPDRYYRLRYEDLVTSPEAVVGELMGWIGEALEPDQLAFNGAAHESGLEDPKVARTSEVHADSVGRWSTLLSPDEARQVWDSTRDLWAAIDPEGCHGSDPCGPADALTAGPRRSSDRDVDL